MRQITLCWSLNKPTKDHGINQPTKHGLQKDHMKGDIQMHIICYHTSDITAVNDKYYATINSEAITDPLTLSGLIAKWKNDNPHAIIDHIFHERDDLTQNDFYSGESFMKYAEKYDIDPANEGLHVNHKGDDLVLVGILPRKTKYPIVAYDNTQRNHIKLTVGYAKKLIDMAKEKQALAAPDKDMKE